MITAVLSLLIINFAGMSIPCRLQTFTIANKRLEIYVPEAAAVQLQYSSNRQAAYWAQVWPASIALCRFLQRYPEYIIHKSVLELAAGLGLPGLWATFNAKHVHITDIEKRAVDCVNQSINHLTLLNVSAAVLNWKDAMNIPLPEVLLLSDVNYEPAVFYELQQLLEYFIKNKVTVIISTPQRLVAKQFVSALLPYCVRQWNDDVMVDDKQTEVSVFVLKQQPAGYSSSLSSN